MRQATVRSTAEDIHTAIAYGGGRFLVSVLQRLSDVIFAPPVVDYRVRTKEALRILGVIPSARVRPPLLPVDDADRRRIANALEAAGLHPVR